MIPPRASLYLSRLVLWPSEFVLLKWTGAEAGQSINKKNWTHLLTLQSDVPDNVESLEIDDFSKSKYILF